MKKKRLISLLSLTALIVAVLIAVNSHALAYDRQSSQENGVRVDVVPVQLQHGQSVRLEIRLNTHSGQLDKDLMAVSVLKDEMGKTYQPTGWDGSPPGGHHRSGILTFPELSQDSGSITLIIKGVAGVPERSFTWRVKR